MSLVVGMALLKNRLVKLYCLLHEAWLKKRSVSLVAKDSLVDLRTKIFHAEFFR